MTEQDYIKAKRLVQDYENEHLKTPRISEHVVAVISLDTHDFKLWKSQSGLRHDGLYRPKRFKIGNVTYYCISKITDLCALEINEIIETKYAKRNEDYEEIKMLAKANLKEYYQ